jgi:quinol-cytochrome oxidoreductase complex cytochrome b subunit
MSGIVIIIFTYVAGITGAIMPCSILAEVTATVIGYAINSLSFINFDFLSTPIIPGLGLTDDTMVRVFLIHGLFPILALLVVVDHLNNLHSTEYTDEDEMELLFFSRYEY